jgi:hypothetical protein
MKLATAELSSDTLVAMQATVQKAELEAVAQLVLLTPLEEDLDEDP